MAFLSPEPVTIYLSSAEMSQLKTDEDSLDWKRREKGQKLTFWVLSTLSVLSEFTCSLPSLERTLQGLQTQPFPLGGAPSTCFPIRKSSLTGPDVNLQSAPSSKTEHLSVSFAF